MHRLPCKTEPPPPLSITQAAMANHIRVKYGELYDLLGYEYDPVYWASESKLVPLLSGV